MQIKVSKPTSEQINKAKTWPIWEKEISEFPWEYTNSEQFYVITGKATVTDNSGKSTTFSKGDFVEMPKGLKCTWKILEKIIKHYQFG